jgi:hypothetical protein
MTWPDNFVCVCVCVCVCVGGWVGVGVCLCVEKSLFVIVLACATNISRNVLVCPLFIDICIHRGDYFSDIVMLCVYVDVL